MTPHESFRNDRMQWIPTMFLSVALFGLCIHYIQHTYTSTTVQHPKNIMPHAYGYGRGPAVCLIYVAKKLFYGLFGSCLARSTYILTCNVTQTQCADLESNILAVFIWSQILVLPNPKYCFSKSWIPDQNFIWLIVLRIIKLFDELIWTLF